MSVPLVTPHNVQVANEPVIRAELIQLAQEYRWAEVRDFCRLLRYFRQYDICPLTRWAEGSGPPPVAGRRKWSRRATASNDWQEPLIEELSKETYNAVAELNALLESAAFDDAARLIASLDAELFQGVAPHVRDRRLLASLPTAVAMALDAYPDFRAAVQKQYGDTSLLRRAPRHPGEQPGGHPIGHGPIRRLAGRRRSSPLAGRSRAIDRLV